MNVRNKVHDPPGSSISYDTVVTVVDVPVKKLSVSKDAQQVA